MIKRTLIALSAVVLIWTGIAIAIAQVNPQSICANCVVGRLGVGSGPAQAIPNNTLFALMQAYLVAQGSVGTTTLTGDVTGSGATTGFATALATVNSNVGSFGSAANCLAITVNGKGLITAASQTACIPAPSAVLDLISPTQGTILYRDAGAWAALAPGSGGQVLASGGPAANPSWTTVTGTGTVTSVTTAAGRGIAVSGSCVITGAGTCTVAIDPSFLQGFIGGYVLSNDGSSPNTVIDVAAGSAASDDGTYFMKAAAFTKNANAAWAVGAATGCLDSGTGLVLSTWYHQYKIARADTNVVDELCSMAPPSLSEAASSISNASPGVVTLANHGLQVGQPIKFTTSGALPTGLTVGTQYYVIAAGFSSSAFEVSATCSGTGCSTGTAVNTSSAGSGTHTITSTPILPANYTVKRRIGSFKTDGSVHILAFTQNNDEFLWAVPTSDISTSTQSTTAILYGLNTPPGVKTNALLAASFGSTAANIGVLLSGPDTTDTPPVYTVLGLSVLQNNIGTAMLSLRTSTSQQIRARSSGGSTFIYGTTQGWIDTRGKSN